MCQFQCPGVEGIKVSNTFATYEGKFELDKKINKELKHCNILILVVRVGYVFGLESCKR